MAEEMYALSRLEAAFDRTKDLLWPFRWGVWLRLAVIALFLGGGASLPNIPQSYGGDDLSPGVAWSPELALLIVALVIVALALAVLWVFIGSTMPFVFVDMLRTGEIRLGRFFRERLGKGVRLFIFQFALTLLLVLAVFALVVMLIGVDGSAATPFLLLALIPAFLVVALLFGIVFLLTTDFVVPIMIREDCGVIEGWRRLIGVISANFWQTAVYIVVKFVLGLIAAIVQAILVILALLVIAIPFILVGIVFLAALQANILLLLALVVPYLVIAIPVALLIAVPFVTFFRYYGLLVLAGLAPEYHLLPE
ncbi:MAG: hypothetical protein PHR49_01155 [Methanoculleus sp.]|nr:hypothetical protein [Methanoculleus sp.]